MEQSVRVERACISEPITVEGFGMAPLKIEGGVVMWGATYVVSFPPHEGFVRRVVTDVKGGRSVRWFTSRGYVPVYAGLSETGEKTQTPAAVCLLYGDGMYLHLLETSNEQFAKLRKAYTNRRKVV